jgi:DNA mismatch repair ATPase MutL
LEDEFKAKKEIERRLAIDNNIRVVQRPQNDVIPYSLKLNFPDLEVLDYMSFSEIFSIGSAAETAFRKQVKLLMIESLVKDKQNVNRSILRVIEIIKDSAKDNLKTLYIEICLRESMQSIYDFVNGLSVNDTIISNAVREQLGRFLAETSPVGTIISNYLSVWNSFYSQEIDIIDVAVKAGEFKDKLK